MEPISVSDTAFVAQQPYLGLQDLKTTKEQLSGTLKQRGAAFPPILEIQEDIARLRNPKAAEASRLILQCAFPLVSVLSPASCEYG